MGGRIDRWQKLIHQPINPLTNPHKIVKLCVDICEYGRVYVNANVAVSTYVSGNVTGCINVHEKNFLHLLTKPNGYAIMASQNKNVRPLGKLNFVFELIKTIPIFEFDF